MLETDEEGGGAVKEHGAFIVGGPEGVEESGRDGKEGKMLDVGVVGGVIRHNCSRELAGGVCGWREGLTMMHVMVLRCGCQ